MNRTQFHDIRQKDATAGENCRVGCEQLSGGKRKPRKTISLMLGLVLALMLTPAVRADLSAPAPAYVPLDAVQLDQLVAPIALDPDSLVAQILTASTYPDQVAAADAWLNQNMGLSPDQRAAGANNMSWDPAVKGLIEFPAVLDNLVKNTNWTSQLGNAYFNQPGDVMNAIQAMRLEAQQSNVLLTTAQQRVVVAAGLIQIVPVNPAVVYVPYYNPWQVWGTLFVAYPGFVVLPPPSGIVVVGGLAFDPGISIAAYASFGWGFSAWAPAWDGGVVLFNHNTYISNSVTVFNHGHFGERDCHAFDHNGRGIPKGFHAAAHAGSARAAADRARTNVAHHASNTSHSASNTHSATHGASGTHSASASHSTASAHSSASLSSSVSAHGSSSASAHSSASGGSSASARTTSSGSRMGSTGRSTGARSASNRQTSSGSRMGSTGRSTGARSASSRQTSSGSRMGSTGRPAGGRAVGRGRR
jgi:hypothetical protein